MSKSPHSYRSQAVIWCLPEVFSRYSEPQAFVNGQESSLDQVQGGLCGGQTEQRPRLHVQAEWRLHLTQGDTQSQQSQVDSALVASMQAAIIHSEGLKASQLTG